MAELIINACLLKEMKLLGEVCSYLGAEKETVIKFSLVPRWRDLMEKLNDDFYTFENLVEYFPNSIGDIMNAVSENILDKIVEINHICLPTNDWSSYNDLAKCDICDTIEILVPCEGEHDEECAYSYQDKCCGKRLCHNCIYIDCDVLEAGCFAIRCEECYDK